VRAIDKVDMVEEVGGDVVECKAGIIFDKVPDVGDEFLRASAESCSGHGVLAECDLLE
jgi:hypothetical protein